MAEALVRACLITNPRSGRGGIDLSEALHVLEEHGWEVSVRQKLHGGHATQLARDAVGLGYNVVVDCGGDGTLSEIVDGVVGTGIAVGVLPGGTANLWAHEVGISSRLRVAALQLVSAERRRVDVGYVTVNGRHGQHFLLMAGLGLDGAIVERVSKPLKNRIGKLAVGLAAARALPAFHAVQARIELDSAHWEGRVSQVIIGNTRRYGGFTRITPDALVDDGQLDVCLFSMSSLAGAGLQLASLLVRRRPSAMTAETYRAAHVTIRTPVVMPLQLDGGYAGHKSEAPTEDGVVYDFSLVAQGISVLIPRTYDDTLFEHRPSAGTAAIVPLRPVVPDGARAKDQHLDGRAPGASRREMTVLAVGAESLTAARVRDGRTTTVLVSPQTVLDDGEGHEQRLWGALSALAQGDLVRVKGKKDHGSIHARQITLLSRRSVDA